MVHSTPIGTIIKLDMEQRWLLVREFAKFLHRNGWLEKYCYNYGIFHNINYVGCSTARKKVEVILDDIWHNSRGDGFQAKMLVLSLDTAFIWDQSVEKMNYWERVSQLWFKEVDRVVMKIIDREKL